VRILITSGDRLREQRGVLRVGNGGIEMAADKESRTLTSLAAINGIHFSRSRQPRWRDAEGKEVAPRVDLGRFGFFRNDRNRIILTTPEAPVILSVENGHVGPVIATLQQRTGLTVQRFQ